MSAQSLGRQHSEPSSETRTAFQRDRDRVIHAKAFRRLKHKTQVFGESISDHHRSRLTHTLEVAQISRHISRVLRLNEDLSETIALAHDLGHSPFGHAGEKILNQLLVNDGGFEHNIQSLRIVDQLEKKYPMFDGLNLTVEVRSGLLKHGGHTDQLNHKQVVSLEAQVVNIADQIAYNNHDLDDGLAEGLLVEPELAESIPLWKQAKDEVKQTYTNLNDHELRHLINSWLISQQINDVIRHTAQTVNQRSIQSLKELQAVTGPIVGFTPEMHQLNRTMRHYLFNHLYTHPTVVQTNSVGQAVIEKLFRHYQAHTPYSNRQIADYISGMTDTYAMEMAKQI